MVEQKPVAPDQRRAELSAATFALLSVVLIVAAHGLAVGWVRSQGFSAISDDDYARVVIAQRFALAPKCDPSGTSWLPFPFWLLGAGLSVFGLDLDTARGLSFAFSAAGHVLLVPAGRWLGLSRGFSLSLALLLALLPDAVYAGAATVPEGFVPALALAAVAALSATGCSGARVWRGFGAVMLTAAALSRYEIWPLVALSALRVTTTRALARRERVALVSTLLSGPLAWMLAGHFQHGNWLFFVKRVAAYRQALGEGHVTLGHALSDYPRALLHFEPGLLLGVAGLLLSARQAPWKASERWLLAHVATLMAFLIYGDLRDGAPTHHPERALLFAWYGLAAAAALRLEYLGPAQRRRKLWMIATTLLASPFLAAAITPERHYAERSVEEALGRDAARLTQGRGVIDHPDYGYFALQAALARPGSSQPLDRHDPRAPTPDPFADLQALSQELTRQRASWWVLRDDHRHRLAAAPLGQVLLGPVLAQHGAFALLALGSNRSGPAPSDPVAPAAGPTTSPSTAASTGISP